MSEVVSRIPVDRTSGNYKRDWHSTQGEQVCKGALLTKLLSVENRTLTMIACVEP